MTKNQPNPRVKRLDDFIYEIETPFEIMREGNKWLKVVRCQIRRQEGYRPQDILCCCDLTANRPYLTDVICFCNILFNNRLAYPINNAPINSIFGSKTVVACLL
jgi:hypothetical protein